MAGGQVEDVVVFFSSPLRCLLLVYQLGAALFVYVGFHLPSLCSMLDVSNEIIWTWISVGTGDPQAQRCEEKIGSLNLFPFFFFFYEEGLGKKDKRK